MAVYVPSRQILTPELRVPRGRPVTPVRINRDLANHYGLVAAWYFMDRSGMRVRDAMGDYHGTLAGTALPIWHPSFGLENDYNANNARVDLGSISGTSRLSGSVTGTISVAARVRRYNYNSSYPRIFDKSNGGSASNGWCFNFFRNTRLEFYIDGSLTRSALFSDVNGQGWMTYGVSAIENGGSLRFFKDGFMFDSATSPANVFPSVTTNASLTNQTVGTDRDLSGDIEYLLVSDSFWTDEQHARVDADPYMFLEPDYPDWALLGTPAGGGPVSLIIQESSHNHLADNITLTQQHQLAVAESLHSHTADNIDLTQAHQLAVQESQHSHLADNIDLTQAQELSVQESTHSHTAGNIDLTQLHILAIQESTHTHTADNVVLTLLGDLEVQGSLHSHTANNIDLTQLHILSIAETAHAHAADNITLNTGTSIIIQESTHAHTAESLALTQAHVLAIQEALHSHLANNIELAIGEATLIISDSLHAHLADQCNVFEQITEIITPEGRIFLIEYENRIIAIANELRVFSIQ